MAGIYYSQPLVGLIAKTFHVETSSSSLIVTLNQLGYGVGLFFIVPLADIVNNKKLILFLVVMAVASLLGFATTQTFSALMAFALFDRPCLLSGPNPRSLRCLFGSGG
ncbi:MFS transporter [Bartonella sp. DGB2]|uniref:MFS transporter n=1 Tax=Bartonella sp. DGB2 TaxID=3388426 RepID=UPI00398FF6C5